MKTLLSRAMQRLADAIIGHAKKHPYFHLEGYMQRFWVLKPRKWLPLSIRVHHILRSDNERHLHDHPWASCSVILRGGYWEEVPVSQHQHPEMDQYPSQRVLKERRPGSIVLRLATDRHRLIVPPGKDCWSLFIMLGKQRQWGFYPPKGWVYWREYMNDGTTETSTDKPGDAA